MNVAFSSKHKDDVENADRLALLFDSRDTAWNAHGKPEALAPKPPRPGGNLEVTAGGEVRALR
jgi:hypothetical protein